MKHPIILLFMAISLMACSQTGPKSSTSEKAPKSTSDIGADRVNDVLKIKDIQVIDVRTTQELQSGMIPGALHIDFYEPDFMQQVEKLDKSKPALLYCRSGGRSANAMSMMQNAGFTELYNLLGGYDTYRKANP
jgi:rhodanese-related sulfurtransferase